MDIQLISAPSNLGLQSNGVELLGKSLLDAGLVEKLGSKHPLIDVPPLNHLRDNKRSADTNCLNAIPVRDFSLILGTNISETITEKQFAFVLGGDCSILIGIMQALKPMGDYGLIFLDAHADFYEPEKSTTGEIADMDLAIVTGRGPELLTNIDDLRPYVLDKNVIHIGQRDWEETKKYGSQDIRETNINCISLDTLERTGMNHVLGKALHQIDRSTVEGFWIHFDTDVLSDDINPAVDYRLPGGLSFEQVEYLIRNLLLTGAMIGISVTIFNSTLDKDGHIAKNIADSLGRAFDLKFGTT